VESDENKRRRQSETSGAIDNVTQWETTSYAVYAPMRRRYTHDIHTVFYQHDDRHSVDMSVTVCFFVILCVCTVTDFSAEDKASGVKFCTAVHRRPGQGISHFGDLCSPSSRKSDDQQPSLACRPGLSDVRATFYL